EELRARHTQDSSAWPSAAYPLDSYTMQTEGAPGGYRLVAAGVEARSPSTPPRAEDAESDEEPPIWAMLVFFWVCLVLGGMMLKVALRQL
ncbi:hypothetical protein LY78DRAFT_591859, partial [Colletotrichum sublineola]